MGKIDTVTTKYMRRNEIFADAFNYFIYDGEQVIDPNSLEELDTKEIGVPYGGEEGAEQPVQKIRDVIKTVTAMMDKKTAYLVLAVESQANIHYAMPIKSLSMTHYSMSDRCRRRFHLIRDPEIIVGLAEMSTFQAL